VRTLPFLLDALKDSSGFVSPAGWQLLQVSGALCDCRLVHCQLT
jgi:hypothetical protein